MLRRPTALLAVACLAGCLNASAAEHDSLAAECPAAMHYPAIGGSGATLAELHALASARLAPLHLTPAWTEDGAAAFNDSAADRARLERLLQVVLPAMERYPQVFFARMAVTQVALVKDLRVAGQARRAMPAPEHDTIVYADNGDPLCPAGMELRAHHELYHVVEYRLFKDFYCRDPRWLALNPPGQGYGQGGATAYGIGFDNLGHPSTGLVSRYAGFGPEEDKAEVFGWMMTGAYAKRLQDWTAADTVLAAKRSYLVAALQAQTDGAMNEAWFARMQRE
ncbi:MAG: hypothetical protein V4463_15420 [Pseudomonadota bacterium]